MARELGKTQEMMEGEGASKSGASGRWGEGTSGVEQQNLSGGK